MCAVLFVWPPAESGTPAHADAIVVLSGDSARLPRAERLVRERVAPVLLISSVARTPDWAAAETLCHSGRYESAHVLCVNAVPYSTRGEAETFSRLARGKGWRSLVVVTSTYHLTRAEVLFRRCFSGKLSMVGAGSPWWQLPLNWASETAKLAVQLVFERAC